MGPVKHDKYDDKSDKLTDKKGDTFWLDKETGQVNKTDISLSGALLNETVGEDVTEDFYKEHPEEKKD